MRSEGGGDAAGSSGVLRRIPESQQLLRRAGGGLPAALHEPERAVETSYHKTAAEGHTVLLVDEQFRLGFPTLLDQALDLMLAPFADQFVALERGKKEDTAKGMLDHLNEPG